MNTNQFNIVPNKVASDYIRGRVAMSPGVFGRLPDDLRGLAFTAAGIESVHTLAQIRDAVARLPEGGDWRKLRNEIAQAIAGEDDAGRGHRARADLILRVNGRKATAAARHADFVSTADIFPYWEYLCSNDGRERDSHRALHKLIFRYDDPFWETHTPPWDWGCRCTIAQLTTEMAEDRGYAVQARDRVKEGWVPPDPESGFSFNPKNLAPDLDNVRDTYAEDWDVLTETLRGTPVTFGDGTLGTAWDWAYRFYRDQDLKVLQEHVRANGTEMVIVRNADTGEIIGKFYGDKTGVKDNNIHRDSKVPVRSEHVHPGLSAFPSPHDVMMACYPSSRGEGIVSKIERYTVIVPEGTSLRRKVEEWGDALDQGKATAGEWQRWMWNQAKIGRLTLKREGLK